MTEDVAEPDLYDSLSGQVALVTGANRGIGREIAEQLHDLGATVFAATRSMTHEIPDEWEHLLVDVTQEGEISDAVDDIFASAGRLDILVNNAAVGGGDGDIVAESVKDLDRTLATNLRGPMLLCKHAVPLLVQDEGGRVVNVSSGMGALNEDQSGGSPSYRVSKTGLNGLTKYLDGEYGDDGLLANSVCPGWVRTDMGGEEADRSVERGAETPVYLCRFEPDSPSGHFWRDREVIDW
ncbi:NAD(P)-dependent dehydrogenase, short-chain alcohol dehydrogenase family [Halogeometricum rufum]|uniref:NAD(P)-dependent dehydrogenase, short-chain alcohol dehydrogenase family n=1 Tax=Halogeometricum rufum TaxID=553469 RepID=A0A1I6HTE7_9EURY|nr:SDR family NAD(P)-dependent oxidoreductase [Halogeometricum rufum]SFR57726.1 NAD(P)-dependent dehydrogenase, short-chain alcohol dehydrogenase family [Halogeometricum rufum]